MPFEVFEKLIGAFFSKLHKKPCYYKLIYMKKVTSAKIVIHCKVMLSLLCTGLH